MNSIENILRVKISLAFNNIFSLTIETYKLSFQKTVKDFEGDITINVFPFLKPVKEITPSMTPELLATELGNYLMKDTKVVKSFNVAKGFLNIVIADEYWCDFFNSMHNDSHYGTVKADRDSKNIMVEYSSPNTNKPLHLGHVRNNLLGHSVSEILKAAGYHVIKTNLVNDRGVHICKSMLAWKKWGNGETPDSTGMKGDKLVGKYYVEFDKHYKEEIKSLIDKGNTKEEAEKNSSLMKEVQDMLRKWEASDKEVIDLWKIMNSWVYKGFAETYGSLGISFDKTYYESGTYLLGKKIVEEGLAKKAFFKKPDGSVWIDLTADGLDEKVILRADGTSVYITQDIGTAIERFKDYPHLHQLIYTVGNEQDYHFKVLFLILKKLGYKWAEECYHLSYGMVELPDGKMKSREGTVVDADDLIDEMINTAKTTTLELGKTADMNSDEAEQLFITTGLGALKYFILKVDPKKKMLFNPKESIDFNGHTGPFIQYTHARIKSVLRKANASEHTATNIKLDPKEKEVIKLLYHYPAIIQEAAKAYNPAHLANYTYELAKGYNQFYHDIPILKEEDTTIKNFRLALSHTTANVIKNSMHLLGIEVPERM